MNSIKILVDSLDNLYSSPDSSHTFLDSIHEYVDDNNDDNDTPENETNTQEETQEKQDTPEPNEEITPVEPAIVPKKWYSLALETILFLPNYLFIKPLIFLWYLITYPFTYVFEGPLEEEHTMLIDQANRDSINEKTELIKQENIIANTIKSPTSSSKYIIPPPQRLFPLSRNPGKKRKKKTLILDLDETLIHSLSRASPRSFGGNGSTQMIEIKLNNVATLYYVHKRPYCDYFLKEAAKWYELQIFTASVKEYADPIIDWLESEITNYVYPTDSKSKPKWPNAESASLQPPRVFTKRYYRNDCTYRMGVGYIKDLSKFFPKDDDLKNVVILDNSPISYALHETNAVMIEGWINDQSDRDLLNLLPMLNSLSLCIDVRYVLGMRQGEKAFES